MRIHCPRCGKLFRVQSGDREITLENHFICTSCDHEFMGRFDPHSRTLKTLVTEEDLFEHEGERREPEITHCPSCQGSIQCLTEECPRCLKIPAKILMQQSAEPQKQDTVASDDAVARRVKGVWQEVLEHFEDPEAHQHFVELCDKLERLDFAEERYLTLKKVIGDDPIVLQSLQTIGERRLQSLHPNEDTRKDPQLRRWQWRFSLYIIGGSMLLLGGVGPSMRFVSFVGVFIVVWLLLDGLKK